MVMEPTLLHPSIIVLTSIIKQPPHVHRPLPLLLLELLAGLQQPLVRHVQRDRRALLVCGERQTRRGRFFPGKPSCSPLKAQPRVSEQTTVSSTDRCRLVKNRYQSKTRGNDQRD